MLTNIVITVAVLIVVFVIVVLLQPTEFGVTRSATMAAPAADIFAQVNDFHKWQTWSPWAKMDPNAKNVFEGPTSGVGSVLSWSSVNPKVGEGRMTMIESVPNQMIRLKVEFFKPFKGTNISEFIFVPNGDQTTLTWAMKGHNNFMSKAVGLFMNCEKLVGGSFEEGLASIKTIVEGKL